MDTATLKVNTRSDHPALTYRGNALKRHQVWLQTNYHQGVLSSSKLFTQGVKIYGRVKEMRQLRRQLRGAASAIAHWYRRVKKMREHCKILLQRSNWSATGIVLKPGMLLNWNQQQVQIVGFARLDSEAVMKAARELPVYQQHYYRDRSCFENGRYWEGGQVPKVLQDENQETHVVVRVLSENLFRYVPCCQIKTSDELQAWRKKLCTSSKDSLTSPSTSSMHVDVKTTANRWTRGEVVEAKRRGTSQEFWVRWKDCLGQRSLQRSLMKVEKIIPPSQDWQEEQKTDSASSMEILRQAFQERECERERKQENKTQLTLDAIVHSLDNSRQANTTTIVCPKAGTTKWTRLTDVYPGGTFVPVATSTIKLLQPGNWIEFEHAKGGAPLHEQATDGKPPPTLIAQVYDLQQCKNTTTVRLLRRRLPAELEVARSVTTSTTVVPFLKYTARNSFHLETFNLHDLHSLSCFKLARRGGVGVQRFFISNLNRIHMDESEHEVDVFVAGAQNSVPSWTRATVKSLTLHPSPKLCLEIQSTEADHVDKGTNKMNATVVTMAVDPLLVARAGEYVKHCQVCQSNLATQVFTCHSHDQNSAGNSNEPDICDECLTQYLTIAISSRTLCELVCPFTERCATTISLRSVRSFDRDLGVAYEKKLKEIQRVANRRVASEDPHFAQWAESRGMKQCPRCFVRIEKNEGCDHMTCFSCGADFQWKSEGVKVVVPPAERRAGHGRAAAATAVSKSKSKSKARVKNRIRLLGEQEEHLVYQHVMRSFESPQSSRSKGSSVQFQRTKSISNSELEKWREQTQKWMKQTGRAGRYAWR